MAVVLVFRDDPEYHLPSSSHYRRPLCNTDLTSREGMLTTKDTLRSNPLRPCIRCHELDPQRFLTQPKSSRSQG
jgi:hypothetical protein